MVELGRRRFDGEIRRLALPALGALAADPLVSLVDTAFVGRIGVNALGSLAVAAAVFGVAFALFNFLAYGTTPLVARVVARDDVAAAGRVSVAAGVTGLVLGVATAALLIPAGGSILSLMGASDQTLDGATTYLRIRALALPAVMLVTVAHGVFRGFQDTRTPLVVTLGLNLINLVLDPILIFGFGAGIAGAAWATVVAQWAGAVWFVTLMWRRRTDLGLAARRPGRSEVRSLLGAGRALVIRTGALLAVLTIATAVAARVGTAQVAAHQVMFQVWLFLTLVLDALAIAGQAMIGKTFGVAVEDAAAISRRLLVLGVWSGAALGLVLLLVAPWLPGWFTDDAGVLDSLRGVYPFLIVMQPLNALVFVCDGIIIGAADFAYLARSMVVSSVVGLVALSLVLPMGWGLAGVWWAIVVLMIGRAATLLWWQLNGPLAASQGPSPGFPEA